ATILIGPKTITATTLTALDALSTFVEIGEVEEIPEFGIKWETGSFTPLKTGLKQKFKTIQDNGTMALTAARKGSDAGQIAARAAAADKQSAYPIKVILGDDTGTGTGHQPSRFYFWALVTSATVKTGKAGDLVTTGITLEITSDIIEGAQVAGS
ncbi:MAG: hypothetical protein RLZZ501_1436, partial [Pseudomonadota bacterium]